MARQQKTYYEILGVKPSAKHNDIGLAYNRLMAARRKESAAPDLKGETMIREAYAVLSDLDRRAAYDAELARARLKPAFGAKQGVLAAVVVAAVGAGIWYFTVKRPADEAARAVGKLPEEIVAAATPAVGKLTSTDLSGQSKPVGLAFAIDTGVMVASCHGIAPSAQLAVNLAPRVVPARVMMVDESLGLCRLEVEGAGSWPLSISGVEARGGDTVYGTSMNAVGQVVLTPARVKSIAPTAQGRFVDSTLPAKTHHPGAPMLDVYGRVVAVATEVGGQQRHVVIPPRWTEAPAAPAAPSIPSAPAEAAAEPAAKAPGEPRPAPAMPNAPGSMTPERIEKLHKAFRPPPNIPEGQDP